MPSWKESRAQKFAPLVATLLLFVFEAIAYKFPPERQIETHTTLTIIKSSVGLWCSWFAIIFWIACLVCSVMSIITKNKWGSLSCLAFLTCPLFAFFTGFDDVMYYVEAGSVRDGDGSEYHLFSNSFLQGNKLMLARVSDRSPSRTNYTILSVGSNSGDANHVRLIRPQGMPEVHAPIITKGRLLIGAPGGWACVFYDLNQKANRSALSDDNYPISKVSPFVLLGPDDVPNQTDFEEAIKHDDFNVTDPVVLKTELQNPSPKVREMAKTWLTKMAEKAAKKP